MKKICHNPFEEHPLTSCYHYIAFPCSIIQANAGDQLDKWLCGKYINCYFKPSSREHKFIISIADGWSSAKLINIFQQINFSKEMFRILKLDPILILKKALLHGCYPTGSCSEQVLFPTQEVLVDSLYDYVISGFDDIKKRLFIHGFSKGIYQHFEVSYETFVKSLIENQKRNITFNLWKYNPNADYSLDLPQIISDLNDYITSQNSKPQYRGPRSFGLQACADFGMFVNKEIQDGNQIDSLCIRSFQEHKHCMLIRIRYLHKEGIVRQDAVCAAENVFQISEHIKELYENDSEDQISKLVMETVSVEKNYLPEVLEKVQKVN